MKKVLLGIAWVALAGVALVVAWPAVFAGADDERPNKRPTRDGKEKGDRPPPPPPPGGAGQLGKVLEDMELDADQKEKVQKIMRAHHEKMRKIMEKAHQDLLKQMKEVLTKEQYQEFEKALKRGPQRPGRPDGPPPGGKDGKRPPRDGKGGKDGKRPPPPPRDDD